MVKKEKKIKEENKEMQEDKATETEEQTEAQAEVQAENNTQADEQEKQEETDEKSDQPSPEEEISELKNRYIRLSAEFDNYRKRTLKEKSELIRSAGEDILSGLLPVLDDFDRAMDNLEKANSLESVKEGIELIHTKFKEFMKQKGVVEIEARHQEFDTDMHEAVTKIPAPEEDLKGKIVDVIEKGYYLNDKVMRYAKVVVGE